MQEKGLELENQDPGFQISGEDYWGKILRICR